MPPARKRCVCIFWQRADPRPMFNLADQLAGHRFSKAFKSGDADHETARPGDHVVGVPRRQRRVGIEDRQTIDGDAARQGHGPRRRHGHDDLARRRLLAIARYIDDLAVGGDAVAVEFADRPCDPRTNTRSAHVAAPGTVDEI